MKRFADREEMEVVGIYEDAGKSGKSIEGRPAFKKMLSDIKNGLEIEYILVYKLSRFGRNAADILNSLEFVQSYGINLICIEEGLIHPRQAESCSYLSCQRLQRLRGKISLSRP